MLARAQATPPPPTPAPGQTFIAANSHTGTVAGYFYGTKEEQLGYHLDAQTAAATTISLADLLHVAEEQPSTVLKSRPHRRRRRADGTRVRGRTWRWNAMRTPEEGTATA